MRGLPLKAGMKRILAPNGQIFEINAVVARGNESRLEVRVVNRGMGTRTTEVPMLEMMMDWMTYHTHIQGKWWVYFSILVSIILITFSMNTSPDQVFNRALRD